MNDFDDVENESLRIYEFGEFNVRVEDVVKQRVLAGGMMQLETADYRKIVVNNNWLCCEVFLYPEESDEV